MVSFVSPDYTLHSGWHYYVLAETGVSTLQDGQVKRQFEEALGNTLANCKDLCMYLFSSNGGFQVLILVSKSFV